MTLSPEEHAHAARLSRISKTLSRACKHTLERIVLVQTHNVASTVGVYVLLGSDSDKGIEEGANKNAEGVYDARQLGSHSCMHAHLQVWPCDTLRPP